MYSRIRSLPAVVDADKDHGWNNAFPDQSIRGFIYLPLGTVERRNRLEQVLSVIEVENRVTVGGILRIFVSGRQPDAKESGVLEDSASEFVESQVSGGGFST